MSWLDGLRYRVRTLLDPRGHERDTADEMEHHLQLDAMQLRDAYAARRRFGNRTYHMEERRRAAGIAWLDTLHQDATYAWRSIRRSPGFTAAVVITLALGIGINAATFGTLDLLYLKQPAKVRDPGSLRRMWVEYVLGDETVSTSADRSFRSPSTNYMLSREVARAVGDSSRVALYTFVENPHARPNVSTVYATWNYFDVLGVRPALGRTYGADEDRLESGGAKVAVVSDRFWRAELGGDRGVIGQPLHVGSKTFTIIGVMPPGFTGVDVNDADAWIPFAAQPVPGWVNTPKWWEANWNYSYKTLVRMPPALTDAQLEQLATDAVRRYNRGKPHPGPDTLMRAFTGPIQMARGPGKPQQDQIISTRLGAVAIIVLLIACANVLNLLLARAVRRRREIAVRLALGISRARLIRLLTTEALLLSLLATGVALLTGAWAGTLLRSLLLPGVDWHQSVLGWRLVWFSVVVGVLCGLVAGLVPALQSSTPQLTPALKEGARETGGRRRTLLRSTLVVAQAALSVVLLAGAALFVRSLRNVTAIDVGFDHDHVVMGWVDFEDRKNPPEAVESSAIDGAERALSQRPEIEAVARAGIQPMWGFSVMPVYTQTDSIHAQGNQYPTYNIVSRNFFSVTGLRVLRGGTFDASAPSVVINEAMARMLWPQRDAIGQCLYLMQRASDCYRVVGIVENGRRTQVLEKEPLPLYYVPTGTLGARTFNATVLLVRPRPGAERAASAALGAELGRALPQGFPQVQSMNEVLDRQYRPWRLGAQLFSAVSLLALVVAIVGIYSTVSYGVSQRTQEFGVRIALGARARDVMSQVLREGLLIVAIGVGAGIVLTVAGGRLISALLYGVTATDLRTLAGVALALLGTAAVAALLPASRAARVDPARALRAD